SVRHDRRGDRDGETRRGVNGRRHLMNCYRLWARGATRQRFGAGTGVNGSSPRIHIGPGLVRAGAGMTHTWPGRTQIRNRPFLLERRLVIAAAPSSTLAMGT